LIGPIPYTSHLKKAFWSNIGGARKIKSSEYQPLKNVRGDRGTIDTGRTGT
jgi:hypothetical protein